MRGRLMEANSAGWAVDWRASKASGAIDPVYEADVLDAQRFLSLSFCCSSRT